MNDTRPDLEEHYKTIIKAILDGRVVPFFGAGVNLCGRPKEVGWQPGGQYLPSGGELSAYLAEQFDYPASDKYDLVRVSQYITVMTGSGPLYEKLHPLFDTDLTPTSPAPDVGSKRLRGAARLATNPSYRGHGDGFRLARTFP